MGAFLSRQQQRRLKRLCADADRLALHRLAGGHGGGGSGPQGRGMKGRQRGSQARGEGFGKALVPVKIGRTCYPVPATRRALP
jgi:hypothetical protein